MVLISLCQGTAARLLAGSGKLRGYIARRTKLPVPVAARSESVATELRRQATDAGHPLWAANIRSIRVSEQQNIAGEKTVWLDAPGRSATFKPPN